MLLAVPGFPLIAIALNVRLPRHRAIACGLTVCALKGLATLVPARTARIRVVLTESCVTQVVIAKPRRRDSRSHRKQHTDQTTGKIRAMHVFLPLGCLVCVRVVLHTAFESVLLVLLACT